MPLVAPRRAHGAGDVVTRPQLAAADLCRRDVDVLARLPVRLRTDEAAPVRQYVQDAAAEIFLTLGTAILVVVVRLLAAAVLLVVRLRIAAVLLPVRHRLLVVARHVGGGALVEVFRVVLGGAGRRVFGDRFLRLGRSILVERDFGIGLLGPRLAALRSDDLLDQLLLAEAAKAFE